MDNKNITHEFTPLVSTVQMMLRMVLGGKRYLVKKLASYDHEISGIH